jgi:hypothetical protein
MEPELAVGLALDLESLLVDRAVMLATEQREIRKRGRPALGPVTDVVALAEANAATGEAAAFVTVLERSP